MYVLEMHVPSEVIYVQSWDFKFSLYKKKSRDLILSSHGKWVSQFEMDSFT